MGVGGREKARPRAGNTPWVMRLLYGARESKRREKEVAGSLVAPANGKDIKGWGGKKTIWGCFRPVGCPLPRGNKKSGETKKGRADLK